MAGTADRELVGSVAAASGGDVVAFGRFVMAHHDDMCRICTYITGDEQLADIDPSVAG